MVSTVLRYTFPQYFSVLSAKTEFYLYNINKKGLVIICGTSLTHDVFGADDVLKAAGGIL